MAITLKWVIAQVEMDESYNPLIAHWRLHAQDGKILEAIFGSLDVRDAYAASGLTPTELTEQIVLDWIFAAREEGWKEQQEAALVNSVTKTRELKARQEATAAGRFWQLDATQRDALETEILKTMV